MGSKPMPIFLSHSDLDIRGLAVTCLGHIARIHKQLDREHVKNILTQLLHDKVISARVEDALGDIEMFLEKQPRT